MLMEDKRMTISPIVPIPVMAVICVVLLLLKRRGTFNFIRQIVIVILLFVMNLRILLPSESMDIYENNIDILFVVDNTISMIAEDHNKNSRRLDGVKDDIADIIDEFPNSKYALISFDEKANYMVPFTLEKDLLLRSVYVLNSHSRNKASGTSINIAYDAMYDALERNADMNEDEERIQLIFFFSDGENTNGNSLESFEELSEYIDGGAVLGYGTKKGGKMYAREDAYDNEISLLVTRDKNYNKSVAISKIDEKNLEALAEDMGVSYYHMTKANTVDEVINDIKSSIEMGTITASDEKREGFYETYWIYALILAVLLLADFVQYRIKFGKQR